STTAATKVSVAGGRYSVTVDPDYRGAGVLAVSAVRRSADGAEISAVSSVPYVLVDGEPILLDRSRLTDLRVTPTAPGVHLILTGGGGGPSPTSTIRNAGQLAD